MVKTRRSVNGDAVDGDPEDGDYAADVSPDPPNEEHVGEWSHNLRSSGRYRRTLQHWPTRIVSRRRRTIKMPRIMFPESDTEPEKYSRRRPVRVFFQEEPASTRTRRPREPKNYMEDSEDKPIQQNVRRSGRQRKLLHHNFNESWITNELKVKGYPGLYGGLCDSSDDCFPARSTNGQSHMDEDGGSKRRTSARSSKQKIPSHLLHSMDTEEDSQDANNTMIPAIVKEEKEQVEGSAATENNEHKKEHPTANDSESNQGPARNMRRRSQRRRLSEEDEKRNQNEESDSESDSSSDISTDMELENQAPRRSNRTRKPPSAYLQLTGQRPSGQRKSFSIRKPITMRKNRYSLRERKQPKMLRRSTIRSQSPSTSSSSSSSDSEADLNVSKKKKTKGRQKSSSGETRHEERALRDIQPIKLDGSIKFSSVGGLEEHIRCLREMVLFPLMYPELFSKFNSRPAKGVLFHGPPGTGKTLLARALANECTQVGGRKVSFFLRKGADCLKKWVGESERHIKLLFQQAHKMRPSIIFFDEIDALAPVRSVRQEQVHTSVVGTLLAEVDGLCDRGEVVVIGATNRPDAVDPALRRAGRFDRELYFPPPGVEARRDILHIYTKGWNTPPSEETLQRVSDLTNGYGGSDLKALCSEAVLRALRRVYPQVYESEHTLVINPEKVEVTEADLLAARSSMVACAARSAPPPARPLPPHSVPLLAPQLHSAVQLVTNIAPHFVDDKVERASTWCGGSMLLCGPCADSHLCPALLAALDRCTVKELGLATIHSTMCFSHEQALITLFSECRRVDRGCVLFLRDVRTLWGALGASGAALFTQLWRSGAAGQNTLVLCSSDVAYQELPEECQALFPPYLGCVYTVREPTVGEVLEFLKPLVVEQSLRTPVRERSEPPPPLPRAPPPPPPKESEEEVVKRKRKEDYKLRELRIFLRDICRKLAANRRFYKFTKPVDLEEVTDYLDIIKQPMDLETMMTKVDMHRYNCAQEFLQDVDLICANALEYNPDRTSSDKQIRHEACSLRDHAHALIEVEMDSDFEQECREIARRRHEEGTTDGDIPSFIYTASHLSGHLLNDTGVKSSNGDSKTEATTGSANRKRRRRITAWAKGLAKRPKTQHKGIKEEQAMITDDDSKENKPIVSSTPIANHSHEESNDDSMTEPEPEPVAEQDRSDSIFHLSSHSQTVILNSPQKAVERTSTGSTKTSPKKRTSGQDSHSDSDKITVNKTELENIVYKNAKHIRTIGLPALLDLYSQLDIVVQRYSQQRDRSKLPAELLSVIHRYAPACKK